MHAYSGIGYGVIFCLISAAFDVYVGYITQSISPAVIILYCFISSAIVFLLFSIFKQGIAVFYKAKANLPLLILTNVAVLLNWGGLIVSLRYLEPAIVGIASVACGPAITTIISRCIDNRNGKNSGLEFIISWLIMVGVILMLFNSLMGKSGVTTTTADERLIGIICVILSALGTVTYTFISRELYQRQWETYEILGFRNMLMLLIAVVYCLYADVPLSINMRLAAPMVLLVVIGHLLPIYLIQNTIKRLQPLHVSLVLLLLPVFTLLLQYFDTRVEVSFDSIAAVSIIAILLFILGINKIIGNPKTRGE